MAAAPNHVGCLQTGLDGRVAWVRLNRAEDRNRLDPSMIQALLGALETAANDPAVGVVLLLQQGGVFSAGIDYEALLAGDCPSDFPENLFRLFAVLCGMPKPVLAAVHGACAGAGIGLLASCHCVLAAQGTKFAVTDIHTGAWPYLYYEILAAAVGGRRARELALTGREFSAADALAWGLVHETAPAFELEDRAFQLASGLASLSPAAVAAGLGFAASPHDARQRFREALESRDLAEGVAAQRAGRRPSWPSLSDGAEK